jgi:AcrR family transcriptional regulator
VSAPAAGRARSEILDAAAVLLGRDGYQAATVRAIAAQVGIKAASIYHHFPSKDAIVQAVLDRGVAVVHEAVVAALAALPADASAEVRLRAALRAHLGASLEHGAYTYAAARGFGSVPAAVRAPNRGVRRAYEDLWRGIVADLQAEGLVDPEIPPDGVRLMLLGALNWANEWYRPGGLSLDAVADAFARVAAGHRLAAAAAATPRIRPL